MTRRSQKVPTCWHVASSLASLPWHYGACHHAALALSFRINRRFCLPAYPRSAGTMIALPVGAQGENCRDVWDTRSVDASDRASEPRVHSMEVCHDTALSPPHGMGAISRSK